MIISHGGVYNVLARVAVGRSGVNYTIVKIKVGMGVRDFPRRVTSGTASLCLRDKRPFSQTRMIKLIVGRFRRGCREFMRARSLDNLGPSCRGVLTGLGRPMHMLSRGSPCRKVTEKVGTNKRLLMRHTSNAIRRMGSKRISMHNLCDCIWGVRRESSGVSNDSFPLVFCYDDKGGGGLPTLTIKDIGLWVGRVLYVEVALYSTRRTLVDEGVVLAEVLHLFLEQWDEDYESYIYFSREV